MNRIGRNPSRPRTWGAGARALGVLPTPPPLPDLSDPGLLWTDTGLSLFPHIDLATPSAINSGINPQTREREWICGPEWIRRPIVDHFGVSFAELVHKIGACRFPTNIGPSLASRLFASWNVLTDLRIDIHEWAPASNDPALKEYFEVIPRNVTRARVHLRLEKFRRRLGPDDLPRDA